MLPLLPLRVTGDLRDVDPAALVRSLARSRETGCLVLSDGDVTRRLFLHGGEVLFAASGHPDDGLGAWLVRAGRLSLEQLAAAAPKVGPERRLGAVLIEEGWLQPEGLVEAVTAQLLAIVDAVLLAERGRYRFDFTEAALRELIVLRRDTRALVLAGLRRVTSVTRVSRGLKALEGRRLTPARDEALAALELDPGEERVLRALPVPWDGGRLPEVPGQAGWDVARAVWALHLAGGLVAAIPRQPTPAPLRPPLVPARPGSAGETAPGPASGSGPEAAPSAAGREELEAALRVFNEQQHTLYRALKVELGVGADIFLRSCLKNLPAPVSATFAGLPYSPAGRWEHEALLARLSGLSGAEVRARLRQAIEAEAQELVRMLDEERAAAIVSALGLGAMPAPVPVDGGPGGG